MASNPMRVDVLSDAKGVAEAAADWIGAEANAAVAARGSFILAVSGGRTPWMMLRALADRAMPWRDTHILQVDERVAPEGDSERNFTHLQESLLARAPLAPGNIYPMPVGADDLHAAAEEYATTLRRIAGTPPIIDVVHLGLGGDGHTASLVPGDPVLSLTDADVAIAGPYEGLMRMTLTYPAINRARRILWVVTGDEKAGVLKRLLAGDGSMPAGLVSRSQAIVLADRGAARLLAIDAGN